MGVPSFQQLVAGAAILRECWHLKGSKVSVGHLMGHCEGALATTNEPR